VTSSETQVAPGDGAAEALAATSNKANLDNLDEPGDEREWQADSQRAFINMLEDIDSDRNRLAATQSAILNILDDFDAERRKVEEANLDLQAVNEAMRGFVAVAAHDLRSPLASIVGFSALLNESWETLNDETRRKFVSTIDRQSHHLSRLVDDLLTLSSVEGGSMTTRPEVIVLAEAIRACLESGGGDTASVAVSCSPDLVVRLDADHLGRILDNYVQNALSYGAPPVQIEAARLGDMVEVRVLDHGLGVPPEFVARLFGKFARSNVPSMRAQKGTGLGLSIVRCADRGQWRPGLLSAQLASGLVFRRPPAVCRQATPVKVLIVVEDDPDVQFLIETVFSTDDGFSVAAVVAAAEEALDIARATELGMIVLDHGLAGELTGLEAAPQFKEVAPQAKIILFTAHAELRGPAADEPAVDAFLLKTDISQLLPLARRLTGLGPPAS